MVTRREVLQWMASLPGVAAASRPWAAPASPSRVALVIGNAAYSASPLTNPVNDANAMAKLFADAGIAVDLQINAPRAGMLAAIERFGAAARDRQVRQAFFYYAGHGVQLEWRNFLLPVDAQAVSAAEVRAKCLDLGLLVGRLSQLKDRTTVIILDACRNNPFGSAYKPEQQGLSQFDAPSGTLLAYATAPGSVASDGTGEHGLYTENLVRELSIRRVRIEDALKRVRLNVRLASRGSQVPWETTSLENDVFLFDEDAKKPSDAERLKDAEEDLAAWEKISTSRSVDEWSAYLRRFPSGRFAEIAQVKILRLMAEREKGVGAARPGDLARVASDEEYDALPVGALYVDPKGNTRRKLR